MPAGRVIVIDVASPQSRPVHHVPPAGRMRAGDDVATEADVSPPSPPWQTAVWGRGRGCAGCTTLLPPALSAFGVHGGRWLMRFSPGHLTPAVACLSELYNHTNLPTKAAAASAASASSSEGTVLV